MTNQTVSPQTVNHNFEVCPSCWGNTTSTVQMGVWVINPDVWVCSEDCRRQFVMDNARPCPRGAQVWDGNNFVQCGQNGVSCPHCEHFDNQ